MNLFTYETRIPQPIDAVFALTVNLEKAPYWHSFFNDVRQLSPNPIGKGSRWRIDYPLGRFTLEIIAYQPPERAVFRGSPVMGMTPNFTIVMGAVPGGTAVHYALHPEAPRLLRPFLVLFAPPLGRWDLNRYFRELEDALAAAGSEPVRSAACT